jgi:hypothetical protein
MAAPTRDAAVIARSSLMVVVYRNAAMDATHATGRGQSVFDAASLVGQVANLPGVEQAGDCQEATPSVGQVANLPGVEQVGNLLHETQRGNSIDILRPRDENHHLEDVFRRNRPVGRSPMAIQFVCPNCNKQHSAAPEFAGRQARCTCGTVLVVPPLAPHPAMPTPPPPAGTPPPSASPGGSTASGSTTATWGAEVVGAGPAAPRFVRRMPAVNQRVLLIGGGVLAALLLIVLVWWLVSRRSGISDAMRYLPDDCLFVAAMNVDEFMSSSFYQQLKKDIPDAEKGEREMEEAMGVAPSSVSRIVIAGGGKAASMSEGDQVTVIRLKKAVSAADIKSNRKVRSFQKDVKYDESKIGSITVFEETYAVAIGGPEGDRKHGVAFCLPETTLLITCPKRETLKKILERGRSPEFTTGMQNAMSAANFTATVALAINVKGLMAHEGGSTLLREALQDQNQLKSIPGFDESVLPNVLGLAVDGSISGSKLTVSANLLCKDGKFAEDAKKILDGGQVIARNALKSTSGVPREIPDTIDAIKFSVSGTNVKGSLQANLEPFNKWIADQVRGGGSGSGRR